MLIFRDPRVHAAMSQRPDGPMGSSKNQGISGAHAIKRKEFLESHSFNPERLAMAGLVHGTRVMRVTKTPRFHSVPNTDALITTARRLPLAIFTADCLPVFLRWPGGVGLVHAGRVGLIAGVVSNTIYEIARSGVRRGRIWAWAGPAIQSCCYPTNLQETLLQQLIEADIKKHQIHISRKCTYCDPKERFISFRRARDHSEETSGNNMMSVIELL